MEPITAAALTALAGSLGGEAGRSAWQALATLVRRPFRRGERGQSAELAGVSSGEAEIALLATDPGSAAHAQALATALGVRAALDTEFRGLLEQWWQDARDAMDGDGAVHNEISGGTQYGPVLQAKSFSSITFTMGQATPPPGNIPNN